MSPPFARLTFAIGSPVAKWTTSSTSMLVYGWPQRRTGRCNIGCLYLIPPNRRRACQAAIRTHATDAVPGVSLARRLAFAFIPLEKTRHEEFLGQGGQLDAARLAIVHNL